MTENNIDSEPNWDSVIDPLHIYSISIKDIYDGDTITCDIDLGFDLILKDQKIRLYGINAPEVKGVERQDGLLSKTKLIKMLGDDTKEIKLYTIHTKNSNNPKKEKFGRWLGIIMCDNVNINKKIVELGYARYKNYD